MYRTAVRAGIEDPNFDGLIVIFVPPVMTRSDEVARAIYEVAQGSPKPVLVCFMGADEGIPGVRELRSRGIPVYTFPESAANAMAALETWGRWRARPEGNAVRYDVTPEPVRAILARARAEGREWLTGPEGREILTAYGLPVVPSVHVTGWNEARAAADSIGWPVVLKRDGSGHEHKSDSGGVHVGLESGEELRRAFTALGGDGQPLVVQAMVRGGRELILGMAVDAVAGPLLMIGSGGTYVELLRDAVFRIHPLKDLDAHEMVREFKGYRLISGFRGEEPADVAGVEEALLRLSQLVGDFPEIAEIDVNPFMARAGAGANQAVDARIRLSAD